MNWLVFNNSQLLHLNEYVKQLEMNQHVFNDIDNVHSSLFPFVCKSAMNWTKSNVNRLETVGSLSSCYVTLPLPTLFLALLRQTDYVNIRKVEDMQDVYQDSFLLSNVWTV